jgi:hypothetical protein
MHAAGVEQRRVADGNGGDADSGDLHGWVSCCWRGRLDRCSVYWVTFSNPKQFSWGRKPRCEAGWL